MSRGPPAGVGGLERGGAPGGKNADRDVGAPRDPVAVGSGPGRSRTRVAFRVLWSPGGADPFRRVGPTARPRRLGPPAYGSVRDFGEVSDRRVAAPGSAPQARRRPPAPKDELRRRPTIKNAQGMVPAELASDSARAQPAFGPRTLEAGSLREVSERPNPQPHVHRPDRDDHTRAVTWADPATADASVPRGPPCSSAGRPPRGERRAIPPSVLGLCGFPPVHVGVAHSWGECVTPPRARCCPNLTFESTLETLVARCACEAVAASRSSAGTSPDPGLMLARWDPEADLNRAGRSRHSMTNDQLLDAVFPDNPRRHPHRIAGGTHAGMRELFGRQRPQLSGRPPRNVGTAESYRTSVRRRRTLWTPSSPVRTPRVGAADRLPTTAVRRHRTP